MSRVERGKKSILRYSDLKKKSAGVRGNKISGIKKNGKKKKREENI